MNTAPTDAASSSSTGSRHLMALLSSFTLPTHHKGKQTALTTTESLSAAGGGGAPAAVSGAVLGGATAGAPEAAAVPSQGNVACLALVLEPLHESLAEVLSYCRQRWVSIWCLQFFKLLSQKNMMKCVERYNAGQGLCVRILNERDKTMLVRHAQAVGGGGRDAVLSHVCL